MAANWHTWRQARISFPLAVVLSIAFLAVSEYSYQRAMSVSHKLEAAIDARLITQNLLRSLLDAETGQRGYLITGEVQYLRPYQDSVNSTNAALDSLRQRYLNTSGADKVFNELERLTAKKMKELALTIALRQVGDNGWKTVVESDSGLLQMDAIRDLCEQLMLQEINAVNQFRNTLRTTLLINRISIAAMTVISLLAFTMFMGQANTLANVQEQLRRQLEQDKERLEIQVSERTQRLLLLTTHLQTIREQERARLARDLHDELGALLVAAKLDLARLKSRVSSDDIYVMERIRHLGEALNNGISFKRRIIEDLHPSSLNKLGLISALEILAAEFSQRSGIEVVCNLQMVQLTADCELTVYRLVQEALTNIAKYASAAHVAITMQSGSGHALISVKDDGIGFNPAAAPVSSHGLEGMRYRVGAHGGTLRVNSAPGNGTEILAVIPQQPPTTAELS